MCLDTCMKPVLVWTCLRMRTTNTEWSISSSVCWPRASSGRGYVVCLSSETMPTWHHFLTIVSGPCHYCPSSIPLVPALYCHCPSSIPLLSPVHATIVPAPYHYCLGSIPPMSQLHTTIVSGPYHYCLRSIQQYFNTRLKDLSQKHVGIVVQKNSSDIILRRSALQTAVRS